MMRDKARCRGTLLVEKYDKDGKFEGFAKAENLFLLSGIDEMWKLFAGAAATAFNNANSRIGIGDSNTAANNGQTDLQAAVNKTYKAMDATYPQAGVSGSYVWRSTFASGDANYVWNEFVLKNNATAICLDRGVQNLGTKVAGAVWVATLTASLT